MDGCFTGDSSVGSGICRRDVSVGAGGSGGIGSLSGAGVAGAAGICSLSVSGLSDLFAHAVMVSRQEQNKVIFRVEAVCFFIIDKGFAG